ncbi:MAG: PTS transporter subunit EIIC [Bacillota bacterium]
MRRGLQKFATAALTPIAVLPAAALLYALGAVIPVPVVANALTASGQALFDNLGLIFGIGIAVGLADGEGIAGLSAGVGYVIMAGIGRSMVPEWNLGILAGLVAGLLSAHFFARYHEIRFPDYLSFFGGQRFVPIITALASVVTGLILGWVFPPVSAGLAALGDWMARSGVWGVAAYGSLERALIPTGMHHFLNGIVLLLQGTYNGAHGDLPRFFAGDPTAGYFMGGSYPIMMFAFPAACLAMYHEAIGDKQRRAIKGLLLTAALTSFITGLTEPVEFTFIFTAPILYVVNVIFTGLSFGLSYLLHIRAGFSTSSGVFEYIMNFYRGQNVILLLPLGVLFGALYYFTFRFLIRRFNLITPGRMEEEGLDEGTTQMLDAIMSGPGKKQAMGEAPAGGPGAPVVGSGAPVAAGVIITAKSPLPERARGIIEALGGLDNLESVDTCLTRLRVVVKDEGRINEAQLKQLGSMGKVRTGKNIWQFVFGTISNDLRAEVRKIMKAEEK